MANLKKSKLNNEPLENYKVLTIDNKCTLSAKETLTSGKEFNAGYIYKQTLTFENVIPMADFSNPCILEILIYARDIMGVTYLSLCEGVLNYSFTTSYTYIKGCWHYYSYNYTDVIYCPIYDLGLLKGFDIFYNTNLTNLTSGYSSNIRCRLRMKNIGEM